MADPWPWPERMDALHAAPASHRVLLDNDRVRVLDVVIEPGTREPEHTHRAASVMIVDEPAGSGITAAPNPTTTTSASTSQSGGTGPPADRRKTVTCSSMGREAA